ncbi:lysylphosphatidylglycerol synthase transmembrane domain-containing protein [Prosthecomicrobium pneumaticum]|uniref:Uncharacterized protein n=1 Tax=Prosthecomicrobium pneumaticum TaxID=81895 RepID=A0A7W9CTR7_9HYPH|nr:YbhN family protein [Prosthecomicrobium pneumaticum]MBB5751262.1 hypothetical protein [Prosthecomicrobium pneumaticum]
MKHRELVWSVVGVGAVAVSSFLLYREVRSLSFDDISDSFYAITWHDWLLAVGGTLMAYGALAWYDRIAVMHLGKKISWPFIALTSFTTYALSHNIGASVLSGAVVRYRAYSTKGLSGQEIGVLVVFCSFTFALGTVLAAGAVLLLRPSLIDRITDVPSWVGFSIGLALVGLGALYMLGSWLHFPPWRIGSFQIQYPRLGVAVRQLFAGPLELAGAAAIIYFTLPEVGNPGYVAILGIFIASFSIALLSHAPGGLGVLEVTFLAALPEMDPADVLAALIVFRMLYLLIPFALSIFVVLGFEASGRRRRAG